MTPNKAHLALEASPQQVVDSDTEARKRGSTNRTEETNETEEARDGEMQNPHKRLSRGVSIFSFSSWTFE